MIEQKGAVPTQRLFFALWPEVELQQRFEQAFLALLPHAGGHRVQKENLHCTLVFLGEVEAAQQLCLEDAASLVHVEPFTLMFDFMGYFRQPQVAWLGCTTTPAALQALVGSLRYGASSCGFTPDSRPYEVHLTVARRLRSDPGRLPFLPVIWQVNQFVMMESVTSLDGVHYRPLRCWNL